MAASVFQHLCEPFGRGPQLSHSNMFYRKDQALQWLQFLNRDETQQGF